MNTNFYGDSKYVIDDSVRLYLKEIANYPLLTDKEEQECSQNIKLIEHCKIVDKKQINLINSYDLKLDVILYSLIDNPLYDVVVNELIKFFNTKTGQNDRQYYQIFKEYRKHSLKLKRALSKKEIKEIFQIEECDIKDIDLDADINVYLNYRNSYEKMFNSNLKLVVSIAKKYVLVMDMMDLISEGNIGLMKAIDRYDVSLGFRFATYAIWWIKQSIKRGIENQKHIIRMPSHYSQSLDKFKRSIEKLESFHKRKLTKAEISDMLNIPLEKVERYFSNMHSVASLNQPAGEDNYMDLVDFIESGDSIEQDVDQKLLKEDIVNLIDTISGMDDFDERSIEILKMRYGLWEYHNEAHTYNEIAEKMGLSYDLVRTIEMKTLRKIRYHMMSRPKLKTLRDYLE